MKLICEVEIKTAIQFTVRFPESNTPYAMSWLELTNNAREHHDCFLKIENTSGRNVIVTCTEESEENVIDYLEFLGDIIYRKMVYVCKPYMNQKAEDYLWSIIDKNDDAEIVMLAPEDLF